MKALSFDDVTLVPNYNPVASRRDVDTSIEFGNLSLKIPLMSAAMDTITGSRMASAMSDLGGLGFLHRFCSIEENVDLYYDSCFQIGHAHDGSDWREVRIAEAVVSLGVNEGLDRFHACHEAGARYFSLDLAHAHSKQAGQFIKQLKEFDETITLVAGSVCTYAGADYLSSCGADVIRVGIGASSICQTRKQTGFGLTQFSALLECSKVDKPIICDGGIRSGGDCMKALVAGATYIMCGSFLGGSEECPGDIIEKDGCQYKILRGQASREAQEDFYGQQNEWKTAEGVQVKVPFKGSVRNAINDLMGGIRSGLTYGGCTNLEKVRGRIEWREISHSGYIEGTPYGQI